MTSSARYKEAIKPMKEASEAVLALQPMTFRYKKEYDPAAIPQFGLIAEQVAKVDPDLVAYDEQGRPYTVRYEAVNAMLLNEFLKEHRRVEEQAKKIDQLEAALQQQAGELRAINARLQSVPGTRLVENR
jgi:trimeric autotransporter adhesin